MAADPRDELYAVPLEDFISTRNALVKEFKATDKELAAEIGKLKKPKLAAWAINQVVRSHRSEVERLVEITDEVASATDAAVLRDASKRRQEQVAKLADAGAEALRSAGHSAGSATVGEIVQTFQAVSEQDARAAVLEGRLVEPLSASGFGTFGTDLSDEAGVEEGRGDEADEEEEKRQLIAELERELTKAKKISTEKSRAAERLRTQFESAEGELREALATIEEMEKRLIDLKGI